MTNFSKQTHSMTSPSRSHPDSSSPRGFESWSAGLFRQFLFLHWSIPSHSWRGTGQALGPLQKDKEGQRQKERQENRQKTIPLTELINLPINYLTNIETKMAWNLLCDKEESVKFKFKSKLLSLILIHKHCNKLLFFLTSGGAVDGAADGTSLFQLLWKLWQPRTIGSVLIVGLLRWLHLF